jgi:hypothetical protein
MLEPFCQVGVKTYLRLPGERQSGGVRVHF